MALYGWCLDGHHANCLVQAPEHRCGCICHIHPELETNNMPVVKEKR